MYAMKTAELLTGITGFLNSRTSIKLSQDTTQLPFLLESMCSNSTKLQTLKRSD